MIEHLVNAEIEELQKAIAFRDGSLEWQTTPRDEEGDNLFHWNFNGEKDNYLGRLEALQRLKTKLPNNN